MKIQTYVRYCAAGATAVYLLFTAGCANRKVEESRSVTDRDSVFVEFPLPQLPDTMRDAETRLRHLLTHYWSEIDWSSAQARTDTAFMEQGMVNFLELMQHADSASAADGYRAFLRSVPREGRPMAEHLISISGDYLFSPDSPVYNPQAYACAIDALLAENVPGAAQAERYRAQHGEVMKNRPGSRAADFRIETRYGRTTTLRKLAREFTRTAKGDARVVLFFYDPDCDACDAVERRLRNDEGLRREIADGRTLFVAVDPYGTDREEWAAHAATLPSEWVIGMAPEVDAEGLYMLRASPTVYVLEPDLTVRIQDARL